MQIILQLLLCMQFQDLTLKYLILKQKYVLSE